MGFINKLGRGLRWFGEKVTHGARVVGNKAGDLLLSAAPIATAINPELGMLATSAGGVLKGVGKLGELGEKALEGKFNLNEARRAGRDVVDNGKQVQRAYGAARNSVKNQIERLR